MSLTTAKIAELAPDQESLNAAKKLMKASSWPSLTKDNDLVWGECQGSGAIPYRTVFDNANAGYKCTCPSRKFPCKHVLALMWMYLEDSSKFADGETPSWVTDWLGRRRSSDKSSSAEPKEANASKLSKSLIAAMGPEPVKPADPKAEARRQAMAQQRAQATQQSIAGGLEELEQWLSDQVRGGLSAFLNDPSAACRTIAARLVDAKAQAMASRLDELPSRLKQVSSELRLDAFILELGRIVLIHRAWKANPTDPELFRLVGSSETRDSVIAMPEAHRVTSIWEVVGEQVTTRRDGLISQATWLLNLQDGLSFALLLDYFPASLGKRSSTFTIGEQFAGELVFYPARYPLRAVIADRQATESGLKEDNDWPLAPVDPLGTYRDIVKRAPWTVEVPLLLPDGRIAQTTSGSWWQAENRSVTLPLSTKPDKEISALCLHQTVALWDGLSLTLLSGQSNWGRWSHDG